MDLDEETIGNGALGERIAVALFNLGGPTSVEAIQPFLFNSFNDPAIIAEIGSPSLWERV